MTQVKVQRFNPRRCGWLPPEKRTPEVQRHADQVVNDLPPFKIIGAKDSSSGKRVVLWDYSRKAVGRHLPTLHQEVGDCVSMGSANAVNYLSCMEIVRLKDREVYRPAFPPFIYGASRVLVGGGRLGNSDGSLGIWAADACRKHGILVADEQGVPPYSGKLARKWGAPPGPPREFLELAKPHCLRTTSIVRSYDEVRDALANGYPVTVASSQGFSMRPSVDKGKHWGKASGTWMHQMAFVGVDDDAARPGCYVLNSWGPDAHGPPADDAPPGGFWVDADVVDRMVRQGDSFAYSQFDGYPAQDLDFHLV